MITWISKNLNKRYLKLGSLPAAGAVSVSSKMDFPV